MTDPAFTRLLTITLAATLAMVCLFSAVPRLDLLITGLFHDPVQGFYASHHPWVFSLNMALRRTLEAFAWAIVIVALIVALRRASLHSDRRNLFFVAASFAIGPGLVVNGVFKNAFGRARPAEVIDFGGAHLFTPVMKITDQCSRNCSFSSGEVAMTATFVFVTLALIWPRVAPRWRGLAVVAGVAMVLGSMALRISLGRHFASDALSSVAISALVTLACWQVFDIAQARPALTGAAIRRDLARAGDGLRRIWPGRVA
ncbi:phosphatase PAP2 family protein [Paracoccus sp. p4-l81]|uniref:phosphatase PAP2 family protein n=1 Tax=unclassified Paracoccus (in: a-proteobacteria) TaxID=2688777 RepID=UPI0035B9398C